MNDTVKELISNIKDPTPSEKKLAKKIVNLDIHEVMYMSITELSEKISSSEATILRFCRKIGFKGFQDFKLALSRDIALNEKEEDLSATSSFLNSISKAIGKVSDTLDEEDINFACKKMLESRRLCAFGIGSSHVAPEFLKQRFLAVGKIVLAEESSHTMAAIASNLTSKDVCLCFSVSGSTKDIIDAAKLAKRGGAYIISITSYPSSPLGKLSDLIFNGCSKDSAPYRGGLTQCMGQLFVAGILAESCVNMLGKEGEKIAFKTIEDFSDKLI